MVLLKHFNQNLLICFKNIVVLYDINSNTESTIFVPTKTDETDTNMKTESISAVATSQCGGYFGIVRDKQVHVYNNTLHLERSMNIKRAANSIAFTLENDILVADKTGDVFLYRMDKDEIDTKLLLGHLSMLLDITMSKDGKFLITCDRDEKIRVSHFPNTYNIESFCLGHSEFVTRIGVLDDAHMLSSSGDGKIIMWDYLNGKILHEINTNQSIEEQDLVGNFLKKMNDEKCEVSCLPVIDMQVYRNESFYIIAVQIYSCKLLQIYSLEVFNSYAAKHPKHQLLQNVTLEHNIISFSLSDSLFVVTNSSIIKYTFNGVQFEVEPNKTLELLYCKYADIAECENINISTMYKRKFDNVQEYLERKRKRICSK